MIQKTSSVTGILVSSLTFLEPNKLLMKLLTLANAGAFVLAFSQLSAQVDTTIVGNRTMMRLDWGQLSSAPSTESNSTTVEPCTSFGYNGKTYAVTEIGDQCWMAESMAARIDSTGAMLTYGNTDWATESAAGPTYYYDSSTGKTVYNSAAANLVCPSGWHLPSIAEYYTMRDYIVQTYGLTNSTAALAIKDETWGAAYHNFLGWNAQNAGYNYLVTAAGAASTGNGNYWATSEKYMVTRGGGGIGLIDVKTVSDDAASGKQVRCVRSMATE